MSKYRIEEGYDHYKKQNLYRVLGVNNEYVGEWHINRKECVKELKDVK